MQAASLVRFVMGLQYAENAWGACKASTSDEYTYLYIYLYLCTRTLEPVFRDALFEWPLIPLWQVQLLLRRLSRYVGRNKESLRDSGGYIV